MTPLFLVNPDLIVFCSQVQTLYKEFGISNGRLLGFHPHDSISKIGRQINDELIKMPPIKMNRVIDRLDKINKYSVFKFFSIYPNYTWEKMAEKLKRDNLADFVISSTNELVELSDDDVEDNIKSVRIYASEENFIKELSNLFKYSSWLTIVDPYFIDDEKRYKLLAKLIKTGHSTKKCKRITILVGKNDYYDKFEKKNVIPKYDKGKIIKDLYSRYFAKDTFYVNVEYKILDDQGVDLFHERVILSNLGGLRFDSMLDLKSKRKEKILCMPESDYLETYIKYETALRELRSDTIILNNNK